MAWGRSYTYTLMKTEAFCQQKSHVGNGEPFQIARSFVFLTGWTSCECSARTESSPVTLSCRVRAKLPAVSLTKVIERERYRPPPAPINVMAVSGKNVLEVRHLLRGLEEKERSGTDGEHSATLPDYFADDIEV